MTEPDATTKHGKQYDEATKRWQENAVDDFDPRTPEPPTPTPSKGTEPE